MAKPQRPILCYCVQFARQLNVGHSSKKVGDTTQHVSKKLLTLSKTRNTSSTIMFTGCTWTLPYSNLNLRGQYSD